MIVSSVFCSRVGKENKVYLGCLSKRQLIIISVAVGLAVLLMVVTAVVVTEKSGTFLKILDNDLLNLHTRVMLFLMSQSPYVCYKQPDKETEL